MQFLLLLHCIKGLSENVFYYFCDLITGNELVLQPIFLYLFGRQKEGLNLLFSEHLAN